MLIRRRRALETTSSHLKEQIETLTQEKTQLAETLAHQRLQYETLSAKADTYCSQATDRLFEATSDATREPSIRSIPVVEEIELELLPRKEALQKGDAP